jgi:3',5'-cyclic AMP phosphodiesterase CpdA
MSQTSLTLVSDPHLSGTHLFFNANWRSVMGRVEAAAPALVVATGDLTVDGAGGNDDLAFAASELARIRATPVASLPGKHDIGEEVPIAGHDQQINPQRREMWLAAFGSDWWMRRLGSWRLIGLNSLLLGSGLIAEDDQWTWLEEALTAEPEQPTGVFVHKPLFLVSPEEPDRPGHATLRTPRLKLLELLRRASVRFVASGHLHQYHARRWGDIEHIWAPSTAFLVDEALSGCVRTLGYVNFTLDDEGAHTHHLVATHDIKAIELRALKGPGGHRLLRDIPPRDVGKLMEMHGIARVDRDFAIGPVG